MKSKETANTTMEQPQRSFHMHLVYSKNINILSFFNFLHSELFFVEILIIYLDNNFFLEGNSSKCNYIYLFIHLIIRYQAIGSNVELVITVGLRFG